MKRRTYTKFNILAYILVVSRCMLVIIKWIMEINQFYELRKNMNGKHLYELDKLINK